MRLLDVYKNLSGLFGQQNWWPVVRGGQCLYLPEFLERPRNRDEIFEIMLGALLTQNTVWGNVVKALTNLESKAGLSLSSIKGLSRDELETLIRPSGYYKQKALKIESLVRFIDNALQGEVMELSKLKPVEARRLLLSVWGIGPETADSILLYGYGMPFFVVDAYTRRVFSRLGLLDEKASYEAVRQFFEENLPDDIRIYRELHALIVEFCKRYCMKTPKCEICPMRTACLYAKLRADYAQLRTE